ncbi:MAG: NUDIX domain-containing protein [Chloroflexota bacterium]
MSIEKSAGVVVFYRGAQIEYLLVHSSYWGFPKGHIESGESERAAAMREAREETGIHVALLDGFRQVDEYAFARRAELVQKQSIYFLGEAASHNARISWEHDDLAWLPFDDAFARLEYEGGKEILRRANEFLKRKR